MKRKFFWFIATVFMFFFTVPNVNAAGESTYNVLSEEHVSYEAIISKPWTINTEPYGTENSVQVPNYLDYLGEVVSVSQEKVTEKGTYALVFHAGSEIGWIDTTGLNTLNVLTSEEVDYYAEITEPWSINTEPWGVRGYESISNEADFVGYEVHVSQEKETERGIYSLVSVEGSQLGWIDKTALAINEWISKSVKTQYEAIITDGWSINTQPWGTPGFEFVQSAGSLVGQTVTVIEETTTDRSTYALLSHNGKVLGWFDKDGLSPHSILETKNVSYQATIAQPWSINTQPWGVYGFQNVAHYEQYHGQYVTIIREAVTPRGSFVLFTVNGQQIGWIDKGALSDEMPIYESYPIQYEAEVSQGWSINSKPWGTKGYKFVQSATSLIGEKVSIIAEKVTPRSTYALLVYKNKELGWFDRDGLDILSVTSESDSNYLGTIIEPWSINTLPWGTYGYERVDSAATYLGQEVQIVKEATTRRGTYSLIAQNGNIIGWLDSGALNKYYPVLETKTANYQTIVIKPWSINSNPWGTKNAKSVADPQDYLWKKVTVSEEKVTPRGTYALINFSGKKIGWIDTTGLGNVRVNHTKNIKYTATLVNPWEITNVPWGTEGYYTTVNSRDYLGEQVTITQEKTTAKAVYAYVSYNGTPLGWVDKTALDIVRVVNRNSVNYRVEISKPWTINTHPWGTEGYQTIPNHTSYIGQTAHVTQEAKTSDGETYVLLAINGVTLGWINQTGVKEPIQKIVYIDPGHGGTDPGASYFGVQEKKINLEVSYKIRDLLEQRGYKVIMSRTTDVSIDYKTERSKMVNASGADIFISVHHNAMPGNSSVNGIETFYYEYDPRYPSKINQDMHNDAERIAESAKLASLIHDALIDKTGAFDRGVRRDTFAVLRETAIPAVLLELGFMSNRAELNKLVKSTYQDVLAKAVVDGIGDYFK